MTLDELKYWGNPPYPVTVTDEVGKPIGTAFSDGTFRPCGESNVGKELVEGYVVSWDGAMPDPAKGGSTKGRLYPLDAPACVDSLHVLAKLVRGYKEEEGE